MMIIYRIEKSFNVGKKPNEKIHNFINKKNRQLETNYVNLKIIMKILSNEMLIL